MQTSGPRDPDGAAGSRPERRYSPLTFFHGLWFVLGGGLWVLWSWWGALLVLLVLVSAWTMVRGLVSPANIAQTRAELTGLVTQLQELRELTEHPTDEPPPENPPS